MGFALKLLYIVTVHLQYNKSVLCSEFPLYYTIIQEDKERKAELCPEMFETSSVGLEAVEATLNGTLVEMFRINMPSVGL